MLLSEKLKDVFTRVWNRINATGNSFDDLVNRKKRFGFAGGEFSALKAEDGFRMKFLSESGQNISILFRPESDPNPNRVQVIVDNGMLLDPNLKLENIPEADKFLIEKIEKSCDEFEVPEVREVITWGASKVQMDKIIEFWERRRSGQNLSPDELQRMEQSMDRIRDFALRTVAESSGQQGEGATSDESRQNSSADNPRPPSSTENPSARGADNSRERGGPRGGASNY